VLATLLATVLTVGGCGADAPAPSAEQDTRPRAEKSEPRPSAPRSATPTPLPPAATASPTGKIAPKLPLLARTDAARSHLLPASSMPVLGADLSWRHRVTGDETLRPVGACQKTPLVDIGAVHAVRRVLRGPDDTGVRARQVVARFVDNTSAWRAREVLTAWRSDCEQRLDYPTKDVGPLRDVSVEAGSGVNYRARYGPKSQPAVAGFGIVRKGRWLSIVELTGPDGTYPDSAKPLRRAVRRIAATFG